MATLEMKIKDVATEQRGNLVWVDKTFVPHEAVTKEQLKAAEKEDPDHDKVTLIAAPTTRPKKLKKIPDENFHDSIIDFFKLHDGMQNFLLAAKLILLVLACQVVDLWAPLMAVPLIFLKGAISIPPLVSSLLSAVQGPEKWNGKDWFLLRPWTVRSFIPIGNSSPSTNLWDYIGGKCKPFNKKKKFYLQYRNKVFAMSPGLPDIIHRSFGELSPLAVPITCTSLKLGDRPVIELDGTAFFICDSDFLASIEGNFRLFYDVWQKFLHWLSKKKHRTEQILKDSESFLPVTRIGRFSKAETEIEVQLLAIGMALLKSFLTFAAKKALLSHDEAQKILMSYWSLALPASAPTPTGGGMTWTNPDVLMDFLSDYIITGIDTIAAPGSICTEMTSGKIHQFADGYYFVAPRQKYSESFLAQLDAIGILPPSSLDRFDLKLQEAMMDGGIPCKSGGRDKTWKNGFYSKGHKPDNVPSSIPCLGIPLVHLPEQAVVCLREHFGEAFEAWCPSPPVPSVSELESCFMEMLDNAMGMMDNAE